MTSQLTAKIRLVKCPRCRRVLPELSNVPVYQCGGCDAVLQVKKRKNGTNGTGVHIYEPEITQRNDVQHDSEGTESPDETKVGEDPLNKIIERGNKEIRQIDGFSSGRESFEAATREVEDHFDQFLLQKIDFNDHDELDSLSEFGHHESEEPSPISLAHCKSQEKNLQNKESSPVVESHDEVAEKENILRKQGGNNGVSFETEISGEFDENAISRYIFGNFKKEKNPQRLSRESTSTENISPPHTEETTEAEPIISRETLENKELSENQNLSNQVFPPKELSCQELEDSSPVVVTQKESKENVLSSFVFGSLKNENRLSEENTMSHNEQVEQPHSRKSSRCNSLSSEESLENIEFSHDDSTYISNDVHNASGTWLGENEDHDHDQFMRELKGKSTENLPTSNYLNSFSREKKAYEPKGFTQGRPVRKWTQFKRDERLSRDNFCPKVSPRGNEYGSSSNYVKNHFHFGKNADFSRTCEDPEEEKLKLKKMVFELQDQLNRTQIQKGYASCGLNHNGYPNSCYQRDIFSDQCKFAHVPFSAEARPQMGHSCLQYSPRDWHCSAPISPHFYSKPSQCTAYTNHNLHNNYCLCSEFPVKNTNERGKIAPKRHVLPLKGGAPFVVCDNCSIILQLPADFLLFKKRYHQLRCGSCSYMHKFCLRNGYFLDRYTDNNVSNDLSPAPPPSEVDDFRDMNKEKRMSINCPHVDSLCISEDYGPSICKSCSTEGDALPYNVQKRDLNRKKIISGGSIDRLNWRKNQSQQSLAIESQSMYKDGNSIVEKSSPTVAKLRGRDVSPLHRLMGYNSARDVFNRDDLEKRK